MQRLITAAMTAICVFLFVPAGKAGTSPGSDRTQVDHGERGQQMQGHPKIDVAFLLDTTGSMAQLIQGAKVKIWSIAKEMLDAEVAPSLRMALIGYRDRGDAYVTRVFDLTDDIDRIYGELLEFQAEGGGDRPESVNQALDDAINGLSWDRGGSVYRVVFLVGDSPPKMNYRDDVKFPVTARLAAQRGIVINTVLAGGAEDTAQIWLDIARLAQGRFVAIPQHGNMQIIDTPFDQDIQALNQKLNDTAMPYGRQVQQEDIRRKLNRNEEAPGSVIADKSSYLRSKGAGEEIVSGRGELVRDLAKGFVALDDLEPEALPAELKGLSIVEQEAVIAEQARIRSSLRNRINALVIEREAYIETQRAGRAEPDSFDGEVGAIIREQGAARGILY